MKRGLLTFTILTGCLAGFSAGCDRPSHPAEYSAAREPLVDDWVTQTSTEPEIRSGIIAQHTLFAHEFVEGGADLNEIGRRDLAILARHFKAYPGQINVRPGGVSPELYKQRTDAVVEALRLAGVDIARVTITNALPGGDGLRSERVVILLVAANTEQAGSSSEKSTGTAGTAGTDETAASTGMPK